MEKINDLAKDFYRQIDLLAKFLSNYLQKISSWCSEKLYYEPKMGVFFRSVSINWSLSWFEDGKFPLNNE